MRQFTDGAFPALVFLWAMLLTGCGKVGLPFSGQVVDVETGRPIEGAFVLAFWKGEVGLFDAQSICYHVETAVSDEEGRFRIPGWFGGGHFGVMNRYIYTLAYKPGYREADGRRHKEKIEMLKFTGGSGERMDYLVSLIKPCGAAGDNENEMLPIRSAIYREARNIAETDTEKETVEWLLKVLERVEFGR
jgi:hypothetical protein